MSEMGGQRSWWGDLRVSQKMGMAFGVLILLSVAIGAIAYVGFDAVRDRIEKADDANRLIKLTQEIRRHEKNFLIRDDEESRFLVQDSIDRVRVQIESTRPKFRNPENVAQIDRVESETREYERSFSAWTRLGATQESLQYDLVREARLFIDKVELLRQGQKQKLADVLERGRKEFEDRLQKADDANRLIKFAQELRIHEKNYMLRGDETALIEIERTSESIRELISDLETRFESPEHLEQLSAIRQSELRYKKAFDAWVDASEEKANRAAAMVVAAREMENQCEALRSDQKRLMEEAIRDAIRAMLGVLLLTLAGGLAMGRAITRGIARPLRGAVEVAEAVSVGDFTRTLEIRQHDEIGDLARSLEVMSGKLADREDKLVEAQQEGFRSIVEAFERGFFFYSTDPDSKLTYVSSSVANVTGFDPEELMPHYRRLFTNDPINKEANRRIDLTAAGEPQASFEVELTAADGALRRLEVSEIPVYDASGRVTGVQGIAHDVSALIEARAEADQASRAKSAFLANMSHELRTPMNAIIGYCEMLMEDAEDTNRSDLLPDLQKIRSASTHLLSLINDILDLSKVEAGRMDLYLERFELAEMIEEVQSTVAPLIAKNGNRLVVKLEEDLGTVRADLTKLRQSLFNLLSNAAKFTEDGTITLSARREAHDSGDRIVLGVADTGIGIAPDKIDHIFNEFSQADQSTSRNFGGTGLGLAISRRFCEMMGGYVEVESRLGLGSIFTITIPAYVDALEVARAAVEEEAESEEGATPAVGAGAVLVIDDDENARELIRRTLEGDGYSVLTASNGPDGLALAREARPGVITLDVSMPGIDGWMVLRELKADEALREIPVVMVSIVHEKGLGFALGAAAYLTKPLDREALLETLGQLQRAEAPGRVLVVDDEADDRELVKRTLENEGWAVIEAENGRVGLERVVQDSPDVIVLDLMMPVMDGFAFLRDLRKSDEGARLPVLVLTAKDLTAEEKELLETQAASVLHKDGFGLEGALSEVRAAVAEHLDAARSGA